MGAEWVGEGSATCAETLGCVQAGTEGDFFQNLTNCVVDSDPAIAEPMSDAVRCLLLSLSAGEDPVASCTEPIGTCLEM
jgi:hypothetical protein